VRNGRIRRSALLTLAAAIASGSANPKHLPWPRKDGDTPVGIDLRARFAEVAAVVRSVTPPKGVERREFTNQVFYRLLRKNFTRSAFDPRKGPLGAYVYTVAVSTRAYDRKTLRSYHQTTQGFSPRLEALLYG
jgi:hypothetical protein